MQCKTFEKLNFIWNKNKHLNEKTCLIYRCLKSAGSLGLCSAHRSTFYRHGNPFEKTRKVFLGTNKNRFLKNVKKTKSCWIWVSHKSTGGYGTFYVWKTAENKGGSKLAHRWAFENWVSPIPKGLEIDHICKIRNCVNPKHLRIVSHLENMHASNTLASLNSNKTHCPNGHKYEAPNILWDKNSRKCKICVYSRMALIRENKKRLLKARIEGC